MKFSLLMVILLAATACAPRQPAPVVMPANTPVPACNCPTTKDESTPTLPQSGDAVHAPVICSCPIILVSPPASTTPVDLDLQPIPAGGITLADSGMSFSAAVGETFLLDLDTGTYDWTVTIDHPDVLGRVSSAAGGQGTYRADAPGQAVLTATGDPACRKAKPACAAPSIYFTITLVVR